MSWRYRFIVIILLAVVGGIFGLYRLVRPAPEPETPLVSFAPEEQPASFRLVVMAEDEGQRRFFFCEAGRCTESPAPESLEDPAVTDGAHWWRYIEAESEQSKLVKKILEERDITTGETKQIIERTPLTSPRGLLISPSGNSLAFFLDNIDRPDDHLTELWVYDEASGGVRLLMEKIFTPDLHTRLRWNRSSSHLWFVADVGEQESDEEVLQFITVSTQPPKAAAKFLTLDWDTLKPIADRGVMDLNQTATKLAYAQPTFLGSAELAVADSSGMVDTTTVRGTISYIQWLEDDSVLYVVQDRQGFSFWRVQDAVHRFIARRPGTLVSALGDSRGDYVVFIAQAAGGPAELQALKHGSGRVGPIAEVPEISGSLHVVHIEQLEQAAKTQPAVSRVLEDAELAAFLEKHGPAIAGQAVITPLRLLTTGQDNTVYFDYRTSQGREERVLVIVRDASLNEWSVKARYVAESAEWRKVQGGGLAEPTSTRLYEWETQLKQWILKEEF